MDFPAPVDFLESDPVLVLGSEPLPTREDFVAALKFFSGFKKSRGESLWDAIQAFTNFKNINAPSPAWNFYRDLLPSIVKSACLPSAPIMLLSSGTPRTVVLPSTQIRHLLSNAFLLNISVLEEEDPTMKRTYGSICLDNLYGWSGYDALAVQRILCFLSYFDQTITMEPYDVRFERHLFAPQDSPFSAFNPTLLITQDFTLTTDSMESSGPGFVDFANKYIHSGFIIASLTQEEVLFSCCPETFLSMMFCQKLEENEVIIVRGVKRFSKYSGFRNSFKWEGFYDHPERATQNIIIMDASEAKDVQFKPSTIIRDLNKAYLGFSSCLGTISTGGWGTGAFGGDKTLKFLQQLCAYSVIKSNGLDIKMTYSCFGDASGFDQLNAIFSALIEKKLTVGALVKLMTDFETIKDQTFLTYFKSQLSSL